MAAHHLVATALVADMASDAAVDAALAKVVDAIAHLGAVAGRVHVTLGRVLSAYDAAVRAGWSTYVCPYSDRPGHGFQVANSGGALVSVSVYGRDVATEEPCLSTAGWP